MGSDTGESNRLKGSWIVPEYTTCNKNSAFEYLHKFKNCLLKFVQVFIDPLKEMSESKKKIIPLCLSGKGASIVHEPIGERSWG